MDLMWEIIIAVTATIVIAILLGLATGSIQNAFTNPAGVIHG